MTPYGVTRLQLVKTWQQKNLVHEILWGVECYAKGWTDRWTDAATISCWPSGPKVKTWHVPSKSRHTCNIILCTPLLWRKIEIFTAKVSKVSGITKVKVSGVWGQQVTWWWAGLHLLFLICEKTKQNKTNKHKGKMWKMNLWLLMQGWDVHFWWQCSATWPQHVCSQLEQENPNMPLQCLTTSDWLTFYMPAIKHVYWWIKMCPW